MTPFSKIPTQLPSLQLKPLHLFTTFAKDITSNSMRKWISTIFSASPTSSLLKLLISPELYPPSNALVLLHVDQTALLLALQLIAAVLFLEILLLPNASNTSTAFPKSVLLVKSLAMKAPVSTVPLTMQLPFLPNHLAHVNVTPPNCSKNWLPLYLLQL
jgi:hypothetical protein